MPIFHKQFQVSGTRENLRAQVVNIFLEELPGTGKGDDTTRYIYDVESTAHGEHVLLHRPAPLNKGMDFIVCTSHTRFSSGRRTFLNPSHRNILDDLLLKQAEHRVNTGYILSLITQLYECKELAWNNLHLPPFAVGHDIELILKLIKWLFIEQDVTYWNWSGRNMLYTSIIGSLG